MQLLLWLVFSFQATVCCQTALKYSRFIWITGGTSLDTGCNKPYECKGRQKRSAEEVIRVLMEQKRQRDLEIWRREDEFITLWRSIYRGDVGRRRRGDGGEGNQTGWTMRAHTDALCLMSRWHFCSPSPPRRPSLAGDVWAEGKSQGRESRERAQARVSGRRRGALPVLHSRSQVPDKVKGQGSWEGQPIRGCASLGEIRLHCQGVFLTLLLCPGAVFLPLRPPLWPSFCLFDNAVSLFYTHTALSSCIALVKRL